MRTRAPLAAAALAIALVAGCSGDGRPDLVGGPGAAASPPSPPTARPLEVGARLWGTRETGLRQVTGFEERGPLTVVSGYGAYAQSDNHVLGVSTRTGEERWRRTLLQPVPGARGAVLWDDGFGVGERPGSSVAVVVSQNTADAGVRAYRLVLLDPRTGTVRRTTDVSAHSLDGGRAEPYVRVVDAVGDTVLVTTTWTGPDASPPPARTTAVDLRSGRVLWQRRGLVAAAVVDGPAGDVVLASDAYQLDGAAPGRWHALRLRSGEVAWARDDVETLSGVARGMAVLSPTSDDDASTVAVDVATGEDLLEVPDDVAATSTTADVGSVRHPGAYLAWLDEDDHLVTYAAGDDEPAVSEGTVRGPLFGVVGAQVTHAGPGPDAVEQQGVVDRAGEAVDGGGPVLFVVTDDVVLTGSYQRSFAVLRRTS